MSFDPSKFVRAEPPSDQYQRQLARLRESKKQVDCIEAAVDGAVRNLSPNERRSFVIYGEPPKRQDRNDDLPYRAAFRRWPRFHPASA